MSAIINIGGIYPAAPPASVSAHAVPAAAGEATVAAASDSVEISAFGQAMSLAAEHSSLSLARIQAVRSEIESGTFETQARIDGTVSRLLDFLK